MASKAIKIHLQLAVAQNAIKTNTLSCVRGGWRKCERRRNTIKSTPPPGALLHAKRGRTCEQHQNIHLQLALVREGGGKTWEWCQYAALWCAWGASEGGACPNIFSMLVGSNESR